MKPDQFFQKLPLLHSLICAFGIAIIASCSKDIKSPPVQTNTSTTENAATTGDITAPTVKFTSPKNGDTVSGTITIKIKATDNVGASVQIKVDGVALETKNVSPYNFVWNTTTVMNGAHQLLAKAVDAAGNSTTRKIIVHTLNNEVLWMEQQIFFLINTERQNRGLIPLTFDNRIFTAARGHARDEAYNNFFSHSGSNGSYLGSRLDAVGYPWFAAGENLASDFTMPIDVFNVWMASFDKREIMLDPYFTDAAVGCGYNFISRSKSYWVLNIGTTQPF